MKNQVTLFPIPETNAVIEKIYVTRGDNLRNDEGFTCDKAIAMKIDGKIYWLEQSFADPSDLEYLLQQFGVYVDTKNRKFGRLDPRTKTACCDTLITKINKHHDDIWVATSSYVKNAVRTEQGRLFWYSHDLISHLKATA